MVTVAAYNLILADQDCVSALYQVRYDLPKRTLSLNGF
jgi:hypothetical protein